MATIEHLNNAPIVEAVVDIKVKLPPETDIATLESIGELISTQYPKKKKQLRFEGKLKFREGELPEHKDVPASVHGYRYETEDEKYILQTRLDGFTFSRLSPYETWGNLRDESYKLWEHYVRVASPEIITRIALRYINRLELPLKMYDFDEYLSSSPTIPEGLSQEVSSFLTRVVIPEKNIGAHALVTQAFESVTGDTVPIILDIDAFMKGEYGIERKAWDDIEKLHDFKNRIFFEFITEKAKELYK